MSEAEAESIESMALIGRVRQMVVVLDDSESVMPAVKRWRGPDLANPLAPSRRRGVDDTPVRTLFTGGRPLRIFLGSDLSAADEAVTRLMHLSKLDDVEVFCGISFDAPVDFTALMSWRLTPELDDNPDEQYFGATVDRDRSRSTHGVLLQPGWRTLATNVFGADEEAAADLWVDLMCHDGLGGDLFVTNCDALLNRLRLRRGSLGSASGAATAPEALQLAELILRMRDGSTALLDHRWRVNTSSAGLRSAVSETRMPSVWAAMRSCLAPSRRETLRGLATHVMSVLQFYDDLLVAGDEALRIRLIEGSEAGDNRTHDDLLYHARQAITLATSCLDCLAWIVAAASDSSPSRYDVSWRALRRPARWVRDLSDERAKHLADASHAHDLAPLMDLVNDVRDASLHRQPVVGGTLHIRPSDRRTGAQSDMAFTIIEIERSAAPVELDQLTTVPGEFRVASRRLLMPHSFVHGLGRALATLLEAVMSALEWPDAESWWEPEDALWRGTRRWLLDLAPLLVGDREPGAG